VSLSGRDPSRRAEELSGLVQRASLMLGLSHRLHRDTAAIGEQLRLARLIIGFNASECVERKFRRGNDSAISDDSLRGAVKRNHAIGLVSLSSLKWGSEVFLGREP
jgi:hypothetical protein